MAYINQVIQKSEQFKSFLNDKTYKTSQQKEVVDSVTNGLDEVTKKFVHVLIENRKLNYIEKIINRYDEFIRTINEEENVKVISARDLTNE